MVAPGARMTGFKHVMDERLRETVSRLANAPQAAFPRACTSMTRLVPAEPDHAALDPIVGARLNAFGRAGEQRHIGIGQHAIRPSGRACPVRHRACRITASFRAGATAHDLRGLQQTGTDDLRKAADIVPAGLLRDQLRKAARAAGVRADDRQPPPRQRFPEPDGQGAGLHADPLKAFAASRRPIRSPAAPARPEVDIRQDISRRDIAWPLRHLFGDGLIAAATRSIGIE